MIKVENNIDTAKVFITGPIDKSFWGDQYSFERFKNDINGDFSNIEVEIATLGGDVVEALAIYDEMKKNPARVKVRIVGATASAGTVIACGGDEIEITENSRYLIHRTQTMAAGNVDEMEKAAEELSSFDDQLVNIYQKRTGKRRSQIKDLMKQDKFLTANEAKEFGFVDRIVKNKVNNQISNDMDVTKLTGLLGVEEAQLEDAVSDLIAFKNRVENERKAAELEQLETLVTAAISENKIKAEAKESFLAMQFDTAKAIIDNILVAPVNIKPLATDPPTAITPNEFMQNYRSNKYANNVDQLKADYKTAYGKEWA